MPRRQTWSSLQISGLDPSPNFVEIIAAGLSLARMLQEGGSYPVEAPPPNPRGEARTAPGEALPQSIPGKANRSPGLVPRQAAQDPDGMPEMEVTTPNPPGGPPGNHSSG